MVDASAVVGAIESTRRAFNKEQVSNAVNKFNVYNEAVTSKMNELNQLVASNSQTINNLQQSAAADKKKYEDVNDKFLRVKAQNNKLGAELAEKINLIDRIRIKTPLPDTMMENGNIQKRVVKWNGTMLTKEVTPEGRIINWNIMQPDGTLRSGTCDPVTMRRTSTYIKNKNGECSITYNISGKSESTVNNKIELPSLVTSSRDRYNAGYLGEAKVLTEKYSDGSTIITTKYCSESNNKSKVTVVKKNADDIIVEKYDEYYATNNDIHKQLSKYNDKGRLVADHIERDNMSVDRIYNGLNAPDIVMKNEYGVLKGKISKYDKFGDPIEYKLNTVYNSDSGATYDHKPVHKVVRVCELRGESNRLVPTKDIVTLNDGSVVELNLVDWNCYANGYSVSRDAKYLMYMPNASIYI